MATIFLSDEDRAGSRSVKVFSTIQGARTGRWCQAEAGAYPDRCDCILEDLSNGVATHFTIQYGTVKGKRVAYRHGHCEKCAPEYAQGRKLYPVPKPLTPSPRPRERVARTPGEGAIESFVARHLLGRDRASDFEEQSSHATPEQTAYLIRTDRLRRVGTASGSGRWARAAKCGP